MLVRIFGFDVASFFADNDGGLEFKVELVQMLRHNLHIAGTDNGLMISKIKDRKLVKFRNHLDSPVAPRGFDVLAESIAVAHRSRTRNGCMKVFVRSFEADFA